MVEVPVHTVQQAALPTLMHMVVVQTVMQAQVHKLVHKQEENRQPYPAPMPTLEQVDMVVD